MSFKYLNSPDNSVDISIEIINRGKVEGKEVVQLYVKNFKDAGGLPHHSLRKISKLHLEPGVRKTVKFILNADDFASFDENGEDRIVPGRYQIFIGGNQPDKRSYELTDQEISFCYIKLENQEDTNE